MIVVTSSNALCVNWRGPGRHMASLRNVHNTAIHSTRSPSRTGGRGTTGVHGCPHEVAPVTHPPAMRDTHGVAHGRRHDPIAASFLVMRGPHGGPLFASSFWPRYTGCSLEALDMTVP